jgi:hypothetical protein
LVFEDKPVTTTKNEEKVFAFFYYLTFGFIVRKYLQKLLPICYLSKAGKSRGFTQLFILFFDSKKKNQLLR